MSPPFAGEITAIFYAADGLTCTDGTRPVAIHRAAVALTLVKRGMAAKPDDPEAL
jgi:hypothetical protein